jgi:hypothetical protein
MGMAVRSNPLHPVRNPRHGQAIRAMDNQRFGSNNSSSKKPPHRKDSREAKEKARSLMVKS